MQATGDVAPRKRIAGTAPAIYDEAIGGPSSPFDKLRTPSPSWGCWAAAQRELSPPSKLQHFGQLAGVAATALGVVGLAPAFASELGGKAADDLAGRLPGLDGFR